MWSQELVELFDVRGFPVVLYVELGLDREHHALQVREMKQVLFLLNHEPPGDMAQTFFGSFAFVSQSYCDLNDVVPFFLS